MLSWLQHRWMGLFLLFMALGALFIFLYGFFPLKYHTGRRSSWDDLPKFVDGISIDGPEVYNNGEISVVLMVIDGLRYDFVTEEYMPYTGGLVKNKSACLYVSVAEPPTVTMPRIKAMMTGSVSTFADVALNFGAPAVKGDSVLRVANATGKRSVMYGDDTWLRLFPGLWAEHDGTTSFYVTDYTEVDNNVTRHLDKTLPPDDKGAPKFDFLVLHYLGLDHIGHLEGARSPKIKPKLKEMDDIVKKIYGYMNKWNRPGVLFICGDHGMRDAGGHGGATPAEVLVPLVVAKTDDFTCPYDKGIGGTVAQVDLSPTVAWLLHAPLPGDSTGRYLPALLPADVTQHLYLLHYQTTHNARALIQQWGDSAKEREFYKQYKRAEKQFAQYLTTGQQTAAKIAREFYAESLELMSKSLTESTVEFDMFAIVLAILLLYMITASLICVSLYSLQRTYKQPNIHYSQPNTIYMFALLLAISSFVLLLSCAITETKSAICSIDLMWSSVFSAVATFCAVTLIVTKTTLHNKIDVSFIKNLNAVDYLLIFGTLLYPWTYFGTSFIEEEHMTWYFLWNMLMCFVLIRTFVVVVMYMSKRYEGATEVQEKPHLQEKMSRVGATMMPQWVLLIGLHRYLRTMNQTGDRWLFLPDTADWLNAPENKFYLELHLLGGTILTTLLCLRNLKHTNNPYKINSILTVAATICILCYRITTHTLSTPLEEITTWDSVNIVNLFWTLLAIETVTEIASFIGILKSNKKNSAFSYQKPKAKTEDYIFDPSQEEPWNLDDVKLNMARSITHLVMNHMMLIIVILMRPHNVIMVPSVYITSKLTVKCMDHNLLGSRPMKTDVEDTLSETLSHLWIGRLFFFYQGNSNSLASVDLGSGYVGLREYHPVRVALRMGLHAYAGPALAGISLYASVAARSTQWDSYLQKVWRTTNLFALERVYSLVIYLIVATLFRHHLYVWSVFSPKILYDFVSTLFTFNALLTIAEIIGLTHLTSWLAKGISYNSGIKRY